MNTQAPIPMITSPCTGICRYDAATGWCLGCGRTEGDIASWGMKPAEERDAIWAKIPARLAQLGIGVRRLPLTTRDIRALVTDTLAARAGTWTMGVVGAVAEFTAGSGQTITHHWDGDVLTATTPGGALRMEITDHVRALTFDPPGTPDARLRIALVVQREKGRLPMAPGITDLGDDIARLLREDRGTLIDLGLARKEARFCVRTGPGAAFDALTAMAGQPLARALPAITGPLLAESPTRVVETALGRIEVGGPIPAPGATMPDGPRAHLLPAQLATGRVLPSGMDLPRSYLPGALFLPATPA